MAVVRCGVRPESQLRWGPPDFVTLRRGLLVIVLAIGALAIAAAVHRATGLWWLTIIASIVPAAVVIGVARQMIRRESADKARLSPPVEPARDEWILPLLPSVFAPKEQFNDPKAYQKLLDLEQRPVLVLNRASLLHDPRRGPPMGPLAPRGRFPEPEAIPVSKLRAGASLGVGVLVLIQAARFLDDLFASLVRGAPFGWSAIFGLLATSLGVWLVLRDSKTRRWLGLDAFGRSIVVGAGWLKDEHGDVFTVDDSVLLVDFDGGVRCVRRDKIVSFYLPRGVRPDPSSRPAGSGLFRRAVGTVVRWSGLAPKRAADPEVPGTDDPLRLLLSSWTYPEPRPDLATRE